MKTVQELAKAINDNCDKFQYFWAYGLLKETVELWAVNETLLNDIARNMLCSVRKNLIPKGDVL
jgi:hypothetical protein